VRNATLGPWHRIDIGPWQESNMQPLIIGIKSIKIDKESMI
jgi:hypothetical protein